VSSRISCHSEVDWAVRRWQILNKPKLFKATSSILISVLLFIAVHHFNMNTGETKLSGLFDIRFASIIFLFRLAGIPVKVKKISTIYAVYTITMIICYFSTLIGMFADVYVHREDLGRVMTTMRVLISFTNFTWIFSNCR